MSDQKTELIQTISDGGIAAKHVLLQDQHALVGPSTANEHNTIKAGIIPIACWRVENFRFAFDSSLPSPEIAKELKLLQELVKDRPPTSKLEGRPGHPLSVFGHADPTGDDEYNKQLSGRRATAIYALLTRDTNLWEKLFGQPFGSDKWGTKALEVMLDTVSPAPQGQTNHEQALQHERNVGKRKELFLRYMETLCGPELKLEKRDFLARGEDVGGKGDFQGCSEFNPVLIFSQEEHRRFEQDKDHTARNAANAPNRRVMVLIFRKGSRVTPSKWPCPRVVERTAACKKRFWSDGEKRRNTRLPSERREFHKGNETFACRFYERLSNKSPCERVVEMVPLRIRLIDVFHEPIKNTKYILDVENFRFENQTNDDGALMELVPSIAKTGTLKIGAWTVTLEIVKLGEADEPRGARLRFENLGLAAVGGGDTVRSVADTTKEGQEVDQLLRRAILRFQSMVDLNPDGTLNK